MWAKIKAWFKDSETIFWARLQMFGGAFLAALVAMDWSPILAADVPSRQQLFYAGVIFVQGFITEVLRRSRAEDM